jgi:quinol-cytochrome oxidoreductase complex cytochrome b subunit
VARGAHVIDDAVRFVDERTGKAPLLHKVLRYVFPEHWSFLLGEIALYAFGVLVATGIYLTLFFEPSRASPRRPTAVPTRRCWDGP